MKVILLILIFTNYLFSNYSLYYSKIKLGEITTFDTVKNDYFKVKVTNSLVKLFLKKDFFIFYTKNFSHTTDSNVKYKKDKYRIIEILNLAIFKKIISKKKLIISENKYIEIINLNNNIYKFEYYKNNKIKTHGTFKVINNKLISFEEKTNNILIIKNK